MSAIKQFLVHVDSSVRSIDRIRLAHHLARKLGGDVTAMVAITPAFIRYPWGFSAEAGMGPALAELDEQRLQLARERYQQAVSGTGASLRWVQGQGLAQSSFSQAGLYADLLILGQRGPREEGDPDVSPDFLPSVVMSSGRPALVVPCTGTLGGSDFGRRWALAWKPSREAARALSAAWPLLSMAEEVHVLRLPESETDHSTDAASPTDTELERLLHAHGIRAHWQQRGPTPAEAVGAALLEMAEAHKADGLIMGCWGHSRAHEWLFGGATRHILEHMRLPVLMAH
jgi:nucleotide-binding universal stress UspA family protein